MMQRSSTHTVESKRMLRDEKVQRFGCKGSNPSASAFDLKKKTELAQDGTLSAAIINFHRDEVALSASSTLSPTSSL